MKQKLVSMLIALFGLLVVVSGVFGMSVFGTMNNSIFSIPALPKGTDITVIVGMVMVAAGWVAYRGKM